MRSIVHVVWRTARIHVFVVNSCHALRSTVPHQVGVRPADGWDARNVRVRGFRLLAGSRLSLGSPADVRPR